MQKYRIVAGIAGMFALLGHPQAAFADEGGVSFWVPGFFGSLAATPQQPGWSVANIYYHTLGFRWRQRGARERNSDRPDTRQSQREPERKRQRQC